MSEHEIDVTGQRLNAMRDALVAAFLREPTQAALADAVVLLAQIGDRILADRLQQLLGAVALDNAALSQLFVAWEDALRDHLTVLVLTQALRDRGQDVQIAQGERRTDVLDAIVLGIPIDIPVPEPEPDDPTGTDSGAHPFR